MTEILDIYFPEYIFSPEYRLEQSVQLTKDGNEWVTINDGEICTLIDFIGVAKDTIWKNPKLSFQVKDGTDKTEIVGARISINEFPIEEYLKFRLKKIVAEAKIFDSPSDASKLVTKIRSDNPNWYFSEKKTGWTRFGQPSEFSP